MGYMTLKRSKKNTLSRHREKAWKAFSLYIRTRDSILTTGGTDYCLCVTCGQQKPRIGSGCIQAGHFIPGRTNSVLFDERGVHGQCWQCNEYKHGAPIEYLTFMQETYGQEVIDELIANKSKTVKYTTDDYDLIARTYNEATEMLMNNISMATRSSVRIGDLLPF